MTKFDPRVFRMYDIRGRVEDQITPELAEAVGHAVGTRIVREGGKRAAVGHDVRPTSPELADRTAAGMARAGLTVLHLGTVPTPVLYHALYRLDLDGGVVVTGSHNPTSDNGLKICQGKSSIWGDQVASLRTQIEAGDLEEGAGQVEPHDYLPSYVEEIVAAFDFKRGHRVAIDTGNGVMGPLVTEVLEKLSVEVVPLFTEPDGRFPNHLPDPEVPAYMVPLGNAVVETSAACGLGFDGDGDRVGVLDERGVKIPADRLLLLFARDLLARHPGGRIRYDVKCSEYLAREIEAAGGIPDMGETGHSLLKRDVKASDAILGGELSGHILFNRGYLPIDDSLYCALYFLSLLDRSDGTASALFDGFPSVVSTPEIKVPCPDEEKFDVVRRLDETLRQEEQDVIDIDGVRVGFPDGSWFLVRASNTTPCLTVRIEAPDDARLDEVRELVTDHLARLGVGPLPAA